jgi:large subunit ribosomal protein L15
MPLQRRLPKFGFKPLNRVEYNGINLDVLQALSEKHNTTDMNLDFFREHGLASKNDRIKILGRGELKSKINVTAHAFSASAKTAIENAGGTITEAGK